MAQYLFTQQHEEPVTIYISRGGEENDTEDN